MSKNFAAWPQGRPHSLDYPRLPVFEILDQTAARVPERAALIFRGRAVTYARLKELSDRLAGALARRGVKPGDRVALHLPNCPAFAVAYYGLLKAGAVFSPVSPLLSPREVALQLEDSGARTVVTTTALYESVHAGSGDTRDLIVTDLADDLDPSDRPIPPPPAGISLLGNLLRTSPPRAPEVSLDPDQDLAHLAYTGGTTGRSKGVMLTHRNVVANVMQNCLWALGGRVETRDGRIHLVPPQETAGPAVFERDREVCLMVPPWFHAMGAVALNNQVFLGSTIIVFARFDPDEYLAAAARFEATFMNGAPPVYGRLFSHPGFKGDELHRVKWAVSGAAPLPRSLIGKMLAHIPGVITEGYGLSECASAATANPPRREAMRPGSIGLPLFDTEIEIVDLDTGRPLPPGKEGEIRIKGPQVMAGYWQNRAATARVLREGWLHTGDIGREDADGYFYVTDRLKDMILYKGYNVYPRELEEILHGHGDIESCAVVGRPDPDVGERPVAFVQARAGRSPDPDELMAFVNDQVASYKKLREVHVIDQIPVSGPGKVLKRVLRDRLDRYPSE